MKPFRLDPKKCAIVVVDVQEKLFPLVEHPCEMLVKIEVLIKGAKMLNVPVYATEQYVKGLGATIKPIKDLLPENAVRADKTVFSAASYLSGSFIPEHTQWIVCGIETHVCVQQTVYDLIAMGYDVAIPNDATSSRSIYDFSTAIAEMRDFGARISSTESLLFELVQDAKHPAFKNFSQLIK